MTIYAESLACSDIIIPLLPDATDSTETAVTGFDSTLPAFGADSALRADIVVHQRGMMGTEPPYSIRNDNSLTIVLLATLMLMLIALATSRPVIGQKLKQLFSSKDSDETGWKQQPLFMHLLAMINCLLMAVAAFVLVSRTLSDGAVENNHITLIAVLCAAFFVFYYAKLAIYTLVNNVFFGTRKSRQWNSSFLVVLDIQAVMMMPIVMLLVFFNLTSQNAIFYLAFVLFLNKIVAFYKTWNIFFREKRAYLQIFLYFCALEIMPLLAFGGEVLMTVNENKFFF